MCGEGKRSPSTLRLMGCALAMAFVAAGLGASSAGAQEGPGPEPGVLHGAYQSPPVTPVKLDIDLATLPRVEPGPFVPAEQSPDDQGEENVPGVGSPGAAAVDGGVLRVTAPVVSGVVRPVRDPDLLRPRRCHASRRMTGHM